MEPLANVNGEQMPLADVRISPLDRGFLFGDAVYEVLRVYQGRPFLREGHFTRLRKSLEAIRIAGVDLQRLEQRMFDTIAAGPFREAIVYIQITRGAAPRRHAFPANAEPLELLWVSEFNDPFREARTQGAAVVTHADLRWDRCDIKSTNLLGNVLAMQQAVEAGCVEALLHRDDGTMTEGTHTSFFGVKDGTLLTAPNSHSILPGITRQLTLELAAEAGIPEREEMMHRDDLSKVSELFLTGTTSEVLPIVKVNDIRIGSGEPGPVTRQLQRAYDEAVRRFVAS